MRKTKSAQRGGVSRGEKRPRKKTAPANFTAGRTDADYPLYVELRDYLDDTRLRRTVENLRKFLSETASAVIAVSGSADDNGVSAEIAETLSVSAQRELQGLAELAVASLGELFQECVAAMTTIARRCEGISAERAAGTMVRFATGTAAWLRAHSADERMRGLFSEIAKGLLHWPSAYSPFPKTSAEYHDAASALPVGMRVPIQIASNKSLTVVGRAAVAVLWAVDEWRRQEGSGLLKVVPEIANIRFCRDHIKVWQRAAGFYMDLRMSSKKRAESIAAKWEAIKKCELMEELREWREDRAWLEEQSGVNLRASLELCGEITEIPEFLATLKAGRDKSAQTLSKLSSRKRNKIIEELEKICPK